MEWVTSELAGAWWRMPLVDEAAVVAAIAAAKAVGGVVAAAAPADDNDEQLMQILPRRRERAIERHISHHRERLKAVASYDHPFGKLHEKRVRLLGRKEFQRLGPDQQLPFMHEANLGPKRCRDVSGRWVLPLSVRAPVARPVAPVEEALPKKQTQALVLNYLIFIDHESFFVIDA